MYGVHNNEICKLEIKVQDRTQNGDWILRVYLRTVWNADLPFLILENEINSRDAMSIVHMGYGLGLHLPIPRLTSQSLHVLDSKDYRLLRWFPLVGGTVRLRIWTDGAME